MTLPALNQPFDSSGSDAGAVSLHGSREFALTSRGGRPYRIFHNLPPDPPSGAGYPAILVLDGNATFLTAAEAVRLQTRKPHGFEPTVVIGLGYPGNEPFAVNDRYLDYTTPAEPGDLPKRKTSEAWPPVGGAAAFLDFIADELLPAVGSRIPIDRSRLTLFGHSLGGFFTFHTLLARPGLFSTYVAGSPSVWWNRHELLERIPAFSIADAELASKRLMIGIGANELDDMVDGARRAAAAFAPFARRGLTFRHYEIAGEEHVTVLPALLSRAIAFTHTAVDMLDKPREY